MRFMRFEKKKKKPNRFTFTISDAVMAFDSIWRRCSFSDSEEAENSLVL